MRYLKLLILAVAIGFGVRIVWTILFSADQAFSIALLTGPVAIWTSRLILAFRAGEITRRIPTIDGGSPMSGVFWSFRPDVYIRKPGFDNFKGYFVGEAVICLLIWILLLAGPIQEHIARSG